MGDLLFRDISPDDYDLLLRLDDGLKRKTASKECVDNLPVADSKDVVGQECMVCLDAFALEDTVLCLPLCGHNFHKECVTKWLLERHRVCPLCSVEVFG